MSHPFPQTPPRKDQEQILLVQPGHLGDMVLTTPALHALRKGFPDAHLSVLAGSWAIGLLKGNPDPDEIIRCDLPWLDRGPHPSWRPIFPLIRRLRARRIDRTVNVRVAAKAACFSRLCGGRERWGLDLRKSRWAWTHTVPYSTDRHIVDTYLDLVRALGAPPIPPQFRLFPETEDPAPVHELLSDPRPAVVVATTAGYPAKFWRPDRWAAVADHIAEKGYRVFLSGGPSETDAIAAVRTQMKRDALSLVGRLNLLQFAALLKNCRALVTLDSFTMHLAAAVGLPLVALFGFTSSRQWGPYTGGRPGIAVEPPPEIPRTAEAMNWIQVPHVIDAFDRLIEQIGPVDSEKIR